MKDLLETALDDEHIEMVIWLLKNDRGLMDHELTDSSTVKERLIQLNEYQYVLSKIRLHIGSLALDTQRRLILTSRRAFNSSCCQK